MKKIKLIFLLITFFLLSIFPIVTAHVPLSSGNNDSIDHSLHVHNPTKSWAIYDELDHGQDARYYQFKLEAGERLRINIFTPEDSEFTPNLVIMGPGLGFNDTVPDFVETVVNADIWVVEGERSDEAEYEPFTPTSYYFIVDVDEKVNVTGTYYAVVYEPEHGGKFGIAIGYIESFSIDEWLLIPFDVYNIHVWEGQHPIIVLAPMILMVVVGWIMLEFRLRKSDRKLYHPFNWMVFAGLTFIGSGAVTLTQMGIAFSRAPVEGSIILTVIFAMIPILLGIFIIRSAVNTKDGFSKLDRLKLGLYGLLGLVFWAGLIIAPVLILILSALPLRIKKKKVNI
jgi:hypothetical protein